MNKQNITKEEVRDIFDNKSGTIKMQNVLNALNTFIRQENNLNILVNNMVSYLKEKGNTDIKTIATIWMHELNKLLKGTYLWEQKVGRQRVATSTLATSGVSALVKKHYIKGTLMPVSEMSESVFMDRELTDEEKMAIRMAKMRAAKKRKAEERKLKEEQEKQRQISLAQMREKSNQVLNTETNELEEIDEAELSEIEWLQNLKF